jgi:diguanylate cyclase (GGDEF)-like protein
MPRKSKAARGSGAVVLLVDDSEEYLDATSSLLEREGHEVLRANSGLEALQILREKKVDLLLIDYFMPGMNAEEVVTELRQFNPFVQVILQTGYASEQPPRELLRRLDIQGYYDKSEGPDKLLLWTDVGLKAAYTVQLLQKSRQGLRYILDVTPELHRVRPLHDLLQGILLQIAGLLGAVHSFLAVVPEGGGLRLVGNDEAEGFVAMVENEEDLVIRASTGRFAHQLSVAACLDSEKQTLVRRALSEGRIQLGAGLTVVPLRVGEALLGVVYLDRAAQQERDVELLSLFANQAAVAIQNSQLYEMATLDPLTGVYMRRFFEQLLLRELGTGFRAGKPTALLLMDLDGFKRINDTAGHLTGDQALAATGNDLRRAIRAADVPGRFGGDEFAVILPQTDADGAEQVARRILETLHATTVHAPEAEFSLAGSIGVAVLEAQAFAPQEIPRPIPPAYYQQVAQALVHAADQALYAAKNHGGGRVERAPALRWPPLAAPDRG